MKHTVVNGSVHTTCKQHQRVCTQIWTLICLRILCERVLILCVRRFLGWQHWDNKRPMHFLLIASRQIIRKIWFRKDNLFLETKVQSQQFEPNWVRSLDSVFTSIDQTFFGIFAENGGRGGPNTGFRLSWWLDKTGISKQWKFSSFQGVLENFGHF